MLTDELLRLVASQPEVRETRRVKVWGSTLRAAVDSGKLRRLDEILNHPDQANELKTFRYGHLIGQPRSPADVRVWQARFSQHPLPADLAALLLHADGVHFWADLDQRRAYLGIAPMDEWQDAADSDAPAIFHEPPVGALVISYHQNGDYFAVLDTATATYRWFDHEDVSNPVVIGSSVSQLLDWFWERAVELRPAST
jgi:hypothetical protein